LLAGIADVPVHQDQFGAKGTDRVEDRIRRRLRREDADRNARGGRVRSQGRAGVARRRHREAFDSERGRTCDGGAQTGDTRFLESIATIDHADTAVALACERAYLDALGGSCNTPIGGYARVAGGGLSFSGIIVKPDGSAAHRATLTGGTGDAERIGAEAGKDLAARGGPAFFTE
jgi:hypothetical protein